MKPDSLVIIKIQLHKERDRYPIYIETFKTTYNDFLMHNNVKFLKPNLLGSIWQEPHTLLTMEKKETQIYASRTGHLM